MSVQELYEQARRELTLNERLLLASRLLNDIVSAEIDERDEWSDADLREFTLSSIRRTDGQSVGDNDGGAW